MIETSVSPDHQHHVDGLQVDVFVTGTWLENCYIVTDQRRSWRAVIDPGDDEERLMAYLEQDPVAVTSLLLTHAHYDHMGAVVALSSRTGATCSVHERDQRLLKQANLYALSFEKRKVRVPKTVELFADGDRLPCGDAAFEVIPSPGHTPGSVCLRLGHAVFSGDTILHRQRGRTDLPGGDHAVLAATIGPLLALLDPGDILYPGHGRPFAVRDASDWWAHEGPNAAGTET